MLSEYQISTISQVWIFLVYLVVISIIYWLKTKSILSSAHGILILIGFGYAVIISEQTEFGPPSFYYWPLIGLVLIGLMSAVISLKEFKGKRWVHVVHLGTIVSGFLIWFVGSMAIAHDWI